jgi:hypothetical protein
MRRLSEGPAQRSRSSLGGEGGTVDGGARLAMISAFLWDTLRKKQITRGAVAHQLQRVATLSLSRSLNFEHNEQGVCPETLFSSSNGFFFLFF